jgi:flap endonuclease-1
MGIKLLNKFLRDNCKRSSIKKIGFQELKNKTLVIDTSIYLYKFMGEKALMEHMYLFISIMLSNSIKPIFIFDGKPPPEKRDLLVQRYLSKQEAKAKYFALKEEEEQNSNVIKSDEEKRELQEEMERLKLRFIRVREQDIRNVKELMDAYGVQYVNAQGEADEVCATYVKSGQAWACMTDDMDMFLYDCPYVLRNLSLMNKTMTLYNRTAILEDLEMTDKEFREIMVLSGTDYNTHGSTSLVETIKWFYEYQRYAKNTERPLGFYVWLYRNTKYITDYLTLLRTIQLFQLSNDIPEELPDKPQNMCALKNIMSKDGFVFI